MIYVEPTRHQDAIRITNHLIDQKLKGYATKNAEYKRRFENNQRDNRVQQPPAKWNGNNDARGRTYTLGGRGEGNPDANIVTSLFLLNNHYECMLFDSGADRSFKSTTFSALLDVVPSTLD
ncbi:hypothetical protein Tco_1138788, partial [Tanacetum coccineum]